MKRLPFLPILVLLGLLPTLPGRASAQVTLGDAPELWLTATADTVLIQVPLPPDPNHGFMLYRAPAGGELEPITPEPVVPVRSPGRAAELIGEELEQAMEVLRAENEVQLFRQIQVDEFNASVMSMLFRGVARTLGRFHADPGVEPGAAYDYRVVFLDEEGQATDEIREGTVTVRDVVPDTVRELTAEADNLEVTVGWVYPEYSGVPLDFVVGFHVYRSTGGAPFERRTRAPVIRNDEAPLRFRDDEVRNGVQYRYVVRALDIADREGPVTRPVDATPFDPSPPSAPERLITEPGDGRVGLAWRMSPEGDLVGYQVERSTGLEAPYEPLNEELVPADRPVWTDSTVVGGTRYFYRVIAVDSAGRRSRPGTAMAAVPFDATPPEPPGEPVVQVEERRLRIRWASSPSSDALGYHVYRGEGEERMVRVNDEIIADTLFLDRGFEGEGLNPGGGYVLRVTAVDASDNESPPATARVVVPDDEAPAGVTALRAKNVRGRRAEILWNASPARDVEAYVLSRSDSGGSGITVLDTLEAAMSPHVFRDTTVVRGRLYTYEVVPVDSAGNRGASVVTTLQFRDFEPPPAPRFAEAAVVEGGVRVTWERVVATDLTGYRIYRAATPTGVYEAVSGLLNPSDGRAFVDPEGLPVHHYTVRAVDGSGNESDPSPVAHTGDGS